LFLTILNSVYNGQNSGQRSAVGGQRSAVSGQRSAVSGQMVLSQRFGPVRTQTNKRNLLPMKIYEFRNCLLNSAERRVIRDGKYLELTPRTFDVLQLLVEKSGEIVTKDEILGKVWNGSFVEEGNLPVHASKLRRLLNDNKAEHFIETVQGSGYRFVSPVKLVNANEWLKHLPSNNGTQPVRTSTRFIFDSIAVMPLRNESNNPEIDYLADGLTESFINSLSRIPDLKVIARDTVFRYKNNSFI
jgi:DNA-binding winged helix-turn-helix (wHTH) protein